MTLGRDLEIMGRRATLSSMYRKSAASVPGVFERPSKYAARPPTYEHKISQVNTNGLAAGVSQPFQPKRTFQISSALETMPLRHMLHGLQVPTPDHLPP